MVLSPPIFPQAIRGRITTAQIAEANGIIVEIPVNSSFSEGDLIRLQFNARIYERFISEEDGQPVIFLVADVFSHLGNNTAYYTVVEPSGRETRSLPAKVFISITLEADDDVVNTH
ncbi:hypothetical protein [Sodalis sp. dw_96]|uniref:hypothetical protein n=1 Tax=Sodalis sp. dw_96 TaxID=2719794 RepID=UPI001BD5E720|nr:hypothetical protein [Sodalis sp. dw_96]